MAADTPFAATLGDISTLNTINSAVNREIWPRPDAEKYGRLEKWADAELEGDGEGDCEDYVIAKRRRLVDAGWPRDALCIAVVQTPAGEGHAVLVARTDAGDWVLDNLTDDVKAWTATDYTWLMIETAERGPDGMRVWRKVA